MQTKRTAIFGFLAALSTPSLLAKTDAPAAPEKIQIALLLDTSNSMDGLIDQARTQLWKVVNTFTEARRNGVAPVVEVALFEYGNNSLDAANGYIRLVEPLGRDLDQLSGDLFALRTNGGEEYCGAVIRRALGDLKWDDSAATYKAIFIAGNEPFTQGDTGAKQACRDALSKHVVVNTIHCGSREAGVAGSWNDGAALAGGKFMVIDQDRAVAHIDAPQDAEISRLSQELNKTYIGYGANWKASAANQSRADHDASANAAAGADVQRAIAKASSNYSNTTWDLVDAMRAKTVDPATIPASELPDSWREIAPEDRAAHIEEAAKERDALQAKIVALNKEREAVVAAEVAKQPSTGGQTLDQALAAAAREQAAALGYSFGK